MIKARTSKLQALRQEHRARESLRQQGGLKLIKGEGLIPTGLSAEAKLYLTETRLEAAKAKLAAQTVAVGAMTVHHGTLSLLVTKSPTERSPYEFEARLPNGLTVPVVVGANLWHRQQANLGEGLSSIPIPLLTLEDGRAGDKRAVTAATVGQIGMLLMGKGELHPPSERYPNGAFLMGEVQAAGPRPGEFRHHDPEFYRTQGRAFAFDHLQRLFPNLVTEGADGQQSLRRIPSVKDWKGFRTSFDIADRPRHVEGPRADVGAYSRVVFDLMAAFETTGDKTILAAAKNAITAQREMFQLRGGDPGAPAALKAGEIIWKSNEQSLGSTVSDDVAPGTNAVPAYLQAYALAGISEYFAATHDPKALDDILGTLRMYKNHYQAKFGFYRVVHPETLEGTDERLGDLKDMVAWNSVGDLDVAALFKLHAALGEPRQGESAAVQEARRLAEEITFEASQVITDRMYDEKSPLLHELFRGETGERVKDWRWQGENGVVGHNFKVAWNLVRFANQFRTQAKVARDQGDVTSAERLEAQASKSERTAFRVWDHIAGIGLDGLNAGVRDVLTRTPEEGLQTGSPWLPTRDFWHQEQALLAAQVLHGLRPDDPQFAEVANRVAMVWNAGFLDVDRQCVSFRTTDTLYKIVEGTYGDLGRADLGYHQGELAMLSAAYNALYLTGRPLDLHYSLSEDRASDEVSVRPDTLQPGRFEIVKVLINGREYALNEQERMSLQFALPQRFRGKDVDVQATIQART